MKPIAVLLLALSLSAHATPADLPGSADHPLLQRFQGAWLVGYRQQAFEALQWAAGPEVKDWDHLKNVSDFEGRVTRLSYLAPMGKTPLEVFRNHEQALVAAGFQTLWRCDRQCDKTFWTWQRHLKPQDGLSYLDATTTTQKGARYSVRSAVTGDDSVRLWTGRLARADGQQVVVQLMVSNAVNELTDRAAAWVQILEPAEMQTGQVVVNAQALGSALAQTGKVALYGLLFDTGKTALRPESTAQLEQMADALKAQPAVNVLIVGHTDNVGSIDANLALSLGRAQAVVAALTQRGIAAPRLQARGVANFAPVASNAAEEGRAKNRRVEMVVR